MTLRFVKTSVLSSTDGIDFSNEVAVESEETKMARIAAERAANKPLFEQLAEQRQKKQDEYDANTKLIFAPPKAIDEEEYSFLRDVEDRMQEKERKKKEEEDREIARFREATKKSETVAQPIKMARPASEPPKKKVEVPMIIKAYLIGELVKRKSESAQGPEVAKEARRSNSDTNSHQPTVSSDDKDATNQADKSNAKSDSKGPVSALGLFSNYGSDEEEGEEE